MIKVCHLISSLWRGNGPGSGILAQLQAQDRQAFPSAVWSMYRPPAERDPQSLLAEWAVDYRVFNMGAAFIDIRVVPSLIQALRRARPDVLHCHLVRANLYGRLAARWAGVPVVISTLRNIEEYMQGGDLVSRLVRACESRTAGWVNRYVAVSESVRQYALRSLQLPPAQVVTILNAVDLSPFEHDFSMREVVRDEWALPPDAIVVGSVGRLHRQKNFAALIQVAAAITQNQPKAYFVISGEGEERATLMALIRAHGLEARFRLTGFRTDIPAVLSAFDLFVLPSIFEGLPRAVMEAMAAGLPCVVTDAGGNAEAVTHGETGYICPIDDSVALTRAVAALVGNPDLRRQLGQASRQRAFAHFGARRMAEQYAELYTYLYDTSGRQGK